MKKIIVISDSFKGTLSGNACLALLVSKGKLGTAATNCNFSFGKKEQVSTLPLLTILTVKPPKMAGMGRRPQEDLCRQMDVRQIRGHRHK